MSMRPPDESGAVAVLTALLAVVLFITAAIAVDIARTVLVRQTLHDTLDTAAHAGAYELPGNGASAKTAALAMARANDPGVVPHVDLWCVVASTGAAKTVRSTQIPWTCNPGPAPYDVARYPGLRCNTKLCAIPCIAEEGDRCNTVRAADSEVVPFDFAPVIGVSEGSTGSVSSVACKGSCGQAPVPMDVVVVADRTASMAESDRLQMVTAIKSMLKTMDPTQQYVALATIHKSKLTDARCVTNSTGAPDGVKGGKWVAVPFSADYKTGPVAADLNVSSALFKGLDCLPESAAGLYGTHLAGALKGAVRYLLGYDTNNLSALPRREGEIRKVVMFETDGMPDEVFKEGSTSLTTSGDVGAGQQFSDGYSTTNGVQGCKNLQAVADQAKARGVLIVSIGFGQAASASCTKGSTSAPYVRDYLSGIASNSADGSASDADSSCSTPELRTTENGDGDFYYCAATGAELGPIFTSALSLASGSVRLIQMP